MSSSAGTSSPATRASRRGSGRSPLDDGVGRHHLLLPTPCPPCTPIPMRSHRRPNKVELAGLRQRPGGQGDPHRAVSSTAFVVTRTILSRSWEPPPCRRDPDDQHVTGDAARRCSARGSRRDVAVDQHGHDVNAFLGGQLRGHVEIEDDPGVVVVEVQTPFPGASLGDGQDEVRCGSSEDVAEGVPSAMLSPMEP